MESNVGTFFCCRQSCGANGIFSRRLDFSAFNSLPRTKLNSYHIKVSEILPFFRDCAYPVRDM